jgi:MFS family permease
VLTFTYQQHARPMQQTIEKKPASFRRLLFLTALIASGETIFLLPFVMARIFRPTFLDVFGLTNLELGSAFSVYGFVALVAYLAGGPLADRFPARRLMAVALVATALGGVVLAAIPDLRTLMALYGFWGLTTILLFWAPLIRATRVWGGASGQGKAYGLLDSGRGLVAAVLASVSVGLFAALLPEDVAAASPEQRAAALSRVIWVFTGLVVAVAALVWVSIPEIDTEREAGEGLTFAGVKRVMRMPAVWLQAVIVVCAYAGYKSTDVFSLYARDVFGYDEVAAARIGTISFWVRPAAAVAAGLLGDRIASSRVIVAAFAIVVAGSLFIALGFLQPGMHVMLIATLVFTCVGVYSLRGVYFAIFEEAKVPLAVTGSAVGVVSVAGFTPDIFMGPLMGFLLDRSPGLPGHQHLFGALAVFGLIGLAAAVGFIRVARKR